MNVRIQRLVRGQRSLALLAKRFTSTEVHPPRSRYPPESYADPVSGKKLNNDAKTRKIDDAFYLHPSLQKVYKADGHIEGAQEAGVHDQDGIPMWGHWGIPIKLVSRSGPCTITL
jgi:hypothetical protein